MSNLVNCPDCNSKISANASTCPRCNTDIRTCYICRTRVGKDRKSTGHGGYMEPFFHPSCYDVFLSQYFSIPPSIQCPDCHTSLASTSLASELPKAGPCPQCGRPMVLVSHGGECFCCKLPIYKDFQQAFSWSTYSADSDFSYDHISHSFCAPPDKLSEWRADQVTLGLQQGGVFGATVAAIVWCLSSPAAAVAVGLLIFLAFFLPAILKSPFK